jgi:hypothetical protein
MAWSVHTWKIKRIYQSRFLSGKVRAKTRHSSYTTRCSEYGTLYSEFNNLTQQIKILDLLYEHKKAQAIIT